MTTLHDRARKLAEELVCCDGEGCKDPICAAEKQSIADYATKLARDFAREALNQHATMRGVHEPDEAWFEAAIAAAEKGSTDDK